VPAAAFAGAAADAKSNFLDAINDDLNMPAALAILWKIVKDRHLNEAAKYGLMLDFDRVLGFKLDAVDTIAIPDDIAVLAREREAARHAKDFARSDNLRRQLLDKGYAVEDTPDGPKIKKL